MIYQGSYLWVLDNSGARLVKCIGILGGGWWWYAKVGDNLKVCVKVWWAGKKVSKGMICWAVLATVNKSVSSYGGELSSADSNAVVLLWKDGLPLGTRVLGAVMVELRYLGFRKVVSLSWMTM